MRYRLYLDESGDHSSSDAAEVGKRYLGLIGVAFADESYREFTRLLDCFKRKHLQYDEDEPPILHREDIINRRGCFGVLNDASKKEVFNADLLRLISGAECRIIAVVIDKAEHGKASYRSLQHPYHYCLHAMLERYCGYLGLKHCSGDVMAEARGGKEDTALKSAYERVWDRGTRYLHADKARMTLTSKRLKVKPKWANVAGLQLADILAHPLTRDVLAKNGRAPEAGDCFAAIVREIAEAKYNRHEFRGTAKGYGRILLE
ncbi:MAG TPA: DUF3800 domain-containing protein [Bryobacteraceae bacterium]|nr:DUF3800 domain-containing protein [Bryobacteraceae bacterium]